MNLQTIPALSKRIVRGSLRRATDLIRLLQPSEKRLLFAFGGRTNHWPGMGSELYAREPVFRESIQETSRLIYEIGSQDVLPNFAGPHNPDFFVDETKIMFSLMALQLALTDLWAAKGIVPDAVMGVSLGEVAAVYAAGGLTRPDAVRITAAWYMASQYEAKQYLSIDINVGLADAQALCRRCPVPLSVVYESGPDNVLVFCRETDKPVVAAFLDRDHIAWHQPLSEPIKPYHTPVYTRHRQFMKTYLRYICPQPLRLDYYSPTLGRKLPKHSLVPVSLWYDLLRSPVRLHTALQRVIADQYAVITHVGPHPFLTGNTQTNAFDLTKSFTMLDSMRHHIRETDLFYQTYRKLRLLHWRKALSGRRPGRIEGDAAVGFVQNLDLSALSAIENPHEVYTYLRTRHRICFLPVHQAWLIFDTDDVNHVLQQPALYSSRLNQYFDPFLVGADPPDHTLVRTMLQPLFTTQAIAKLGDYIGRETERRLTALAGRDQVDVVDELTLPLVQSVIAHFLGLLPTEADALQRSLTSHVYSMTYLTELEAFFRAYLEREPDTHPGSLLLEQVRAGQLPLAGAVSLLKLLWVAGTTTSSMLLSNLINALILHPHLAEQLRDDEALIPRFVEECLRLEPPEPNIWRITTQETVLAGQTLPANSLVILGTAGTNRDPQVFADPDEWSLTRPAKRHFTFGGGYHHCIGVGIARLEAQLFVRAILAQWPQLRAAESGPTVYYPAPHQRGLAKLLVCPS